jgi:hypothetical protein
MLLMPREQAMMLSSGSWQVDMTSPDGVVNIISYDHVNDI